MNMVINHMCRFFGKIENPELIKLPQDMETLLHDLVIVVRQTSTPSQQPSTFSIVGNGLYSFRATFQVRSMNQRDFR